MGTGQVYRHAVLDAYISLAALQADLDAWLHRHNYELKRTLFRETLSPLHSGVGMPPFPGKFVSNNAGQLWHPG